jgi:Ca2+-binding RTX toxin-like protein
MRGSEGRFRSSIEIQTLEARRLLTTASVNAAHVLNILGTSGDDIILVSRISSGRVSVSGVTARFTPGNGAGEFNRTNITAGDGDDRVTIASNVPYMSATLNGEGGNDTLVGGKGNDSLLGGDFNDTLDGGPGGGDALIGGNGFDTANYSSRTDNLTITFDGKSNDGANGGAEKDNVQTEEIISGSGNDTITGSAGDDFICGGAGDDVLKGMGGDDDLIAGVGNDQIFGNDGNDFLQAKNQDRDTVNGGSNSDGSADFDLASVDAIDQPGLATRGAAAGDDSSVGIEQFLSDEDLLGHNLIIPLAARLQNLTIWSKLCVFGQPNSAGEVTLNTALRDDQVIFSNINVNGTPLIAVNINGVVLTYDPKTTTRITINTSDGNDVIQASDRIRVPLEIHGGNGNDSIIGGAREDSLFGDAGNDTLRGGAKSDVLVGGDDEDVLFGNDGRDVLIGGDGVDHLYGERGQDILIGGTTSYDDKPDVLGAIRSEWNSTASFKDRIDHLTNGGGLNGDVILSNGPDFTVFADKGGNLLNGGYDTDWFFKGATDTTKQGTGEVIEKV